MRVTIEHEIDLEDLVDECHEQIIGIIKDSDHAESLSSFANQEHFHLTLDEIVERLNKVRDRIEQNKRFMNACFGERDDEILLLIENIKLYKNKEL